MMAQSLDTAFLIECVHYSSAQFRRSAGVSRIFAQGGPQLLQILEQGLAFGATLTVSFDIRGGERIEFAVEVGVYAQ
jgi:hypothetical protein